MLLAGHTAAEDPSVQSEMLRWAEVSFGGSVEAPARQPFALELRRQDHGRLRRNQSVIGTSPITIGRQRFQHGLGTHANSEILVTFPAGSVRSFAASVGIDNNRDTGGRRGSVIFIVEASDKELFRSDILRGGQEPTKVNVAVPDGAESLVLKVSTPDEPSHDHADWADARLVKADGTILWLDQIEPVLPAPGPPFSFVYAEQTSGALLGEWKHQTQRTEGDGRVRCVTTWTDAKTGLVVTATAVVFKDFPAVDWVLRFTNGGRADTPILQNVHALDMVLDTSPDQPVVMDQIAGDDCSERSFVPFERPLQPGEDYSFAPVGGRPSNGAFPFFNVQLGRGGTFVAIGWTGQWAARVGRDPDGTTRLRAGMEQTHLKLHPGESIRTPSIMLLRWTGDRIDGHNSFRRLLLTHYQPKLDGKSVRPAIAAQTFNRWHGGTRPEWGRESGQIAAARIEREIGCDTHWFDAGWFEGYFPNGVGNWTCRPNDFPRGLKPIGDACNELGLKFLVWYEPERVAPGTRFAREYPEFILPKDGNGGLFNLGDENARRFLTDLLIGQIAEFGIDTYRNDFNMDPLPYWRQNDGPDRQGITEIRYVEGLYAMWDEIRVKYPHMYLDDCASGGRRIDVEMLKRSIVQTRSDTACRAGRSDWDQSQTYGLSLYLPIHATIGWEVGAYQCRSSATAGLCAEWDVLDPAFPLEDARACVAEIRENQKYWYGDYYPLTAWSIAPEHWMAYQFHLPDEDEGMVLAFRREASPYAVLQVTLRGVDPEHTYLVTFIDEQHQSMTRPMTGKDLAALELRIPIRKNSLLVRYARHGEM